MTDSSKSWLAEKKMAREGSWLLPERQTERGREVTDSSRDKVIIFREIQALRKDKERARRESCGSEDTESESVVEEKKVGGLGPEGTWIIDESDKATTKRKRQRLERH
jgi:hypothetical protein